MTIDSILNHLSQQSYTVRRENLAELPNATSSVAWYQHLLLGIGVFTTFVCFLMLLAIAGFFDIGHIGQSIWAVGFIVVAILLYRGVAAGRAQSSQLSEVFVTQVTFVLIIAGKGLLLYHLCHFLELTQLWQVTLVAALLTILTFPLYPVMLSRIVSVAVLLFFMQLMVPHGLTSAPLAVIYQSVFFLLSLVVLLYLSFSSRCLAWQYLRYAIIAILFVHLTFTAGYVAEIPQIFLSQKNHVIQTTFAVFYPSWIIAVVLCGCTIYLAGEHRKFYGVWLLCLALLVLAYFLPPTLFFAVLLVVLGYATRDSVMTGLGLLLIPYYLFKYYYDLQWSLLDKSLLLMASGVLLFVVAFAVAKLPQPHHSEEKS